MAVNLKLRNLLFAIYAVEPETLRKHVPEQLELDVRETASGTRAFVATVALEAGAAFPYLLSGFRQVNYRVYVQHHGHPGVFFLRSWVSSRAAAAAMNLAVHTEHSDLQITISDQPTRYSSYDVRGHSGETVLELTAHAVTAADYPPFRSREEAVTFLTHRLAGYASDHRKGGLSIIRVEHGPMDPLRAALTHARADYWTDLGILTAQDLMRPFVVLIQPETEFAMNLPERVA